MSYDVYIAGYVESFQHLGTETTSVSRSVQMNTNVVQGLGRETRDIPGEKEVSSPVDTCWWHHTAVQNGIEYSIMHFVSPLWNVTKPSKHETLTQCRLNVGPASQTVDQQ